MLRDRKIGPLFNGLIPLTYHNPRKRMFLSLDCDQGRVDKSKILIRAISSAFHLRFFFVVIFIFVFVFPGNEVEFSRLFRGKLCTEPCCGES